MSSIEDTYQKKDLHEHIISRPEMYIGSIDNIKDNIIVFDEENDKLVNKNVLYNPGFLKIFDEILVNAIDHSKRDKTVSYIKIDINNDFISIENNGSGIPIEIHQKHKIYIPELLFGNLLSSSNYNDNETRVVGGLNGLGASLANIYSKKFIVETCYNEIYYYQLWENNMYLCHKPKIRKCKKKDYTKVTFYPDLERFNINNILNFTGLLYKRVYDTAAFIRSGVNIFLNGKKIKIGISHYIKILGHNTDLSQYYIERFEKGDFVWEYAISFLGCESNTFSQISFVNGINTIRGGKHVDYIINQVIYIIDEYLKKKKVNIRRNTIKNCLNIIINATIDKPKFDNQSKEYLISSYSNFGVSFKINNKNLLIKLKKSGMIDYLIQVSKEKEHKDLDKKSDGKKISRLLIKNLYDAKLAGTKRSSECSLILTEGLSAQAFAKCSQDDTLLGIEKYGIFPLKGKLLNTRSATISQLSNNEEINNIKQIIGLKNNMVYKDTKELRYGRILLLCDADLDGIHIKSLIVNFIQHFWPDLLKIDNFIQTINTPLIKATKGKQIMEFYNEQEFLKWKNSQADIKKYKIKYFKGLGTSTKDDAKKYFKNMRTINYKYNDGACFDSIRLAFEKKEDSTQKRKEWLRYYNKDEVICKDTNSISYTELINKELIHFSIYDNKRSIPCLLDGLKPSQRKIIHYMLKKNIVKEIKVGQLSGYISAETAYHHGEASLQQTIINLAQDYIGSNNINLLIPEGQFGSLTDNGHDAASPRYIYTYLNNITTDIYNKLDLPLMNYLIDENQIIEPDWFIPIIPMVLVNGAEGIGTGYSTFIPSYNPNDIINNLLLMIDNKEPNRLFPYYRGFTGTVKQVNEHFTVCGRYKMEVGNNKNILKIECLPIGTSINNYIDFLTKLEQEKKIKKFSNNSKNEDVCFHIELIKESKDIVKDFKLSKKINLTNMHLFNRYSQLNKYTTELDIIYEFFDIRMEFYQKRKDYITNELKEQTDLLKNKIKFIKGYIKGNIRINNIKKVEIEKQLKELQFMTVNNTYDYLTNLPIIALTEERITELKNKYDDIKRELETIQNKTIKQLYREDLINLQKKLI